MYVFKSTWHYIMDYKLVLNASLNRNVESCFLKVARVLQDLIRNGYESNVAGKSSINKGTIPWCKAVDPWSEQERLSWQEKSIV